MRLLQIALIKDNGETKEHTPRSLISISEIFGRADLKTTQIYLDSFDDDALDAANEGIVAWFSQRMVRNGKNVHF